MAEYFANGCKVFHKEKSLLILILALLISLTMGIPLTSASAYNRTSAVFLTDADSGEMLYAENADVRMEIASTTKILTAITVIEHSDPFMSYSIPKAAVGVEGSSIYLKEGEKWRILDLLYGLMLRSGNDAATALALATSGNVEAFTSLMNETALQIGATKSHFVNPHGLHDNDHYSTARDLALITAYALRSPIFADICKTKTHRCTKQTPQGEEQVIFYNKNKLLYSYEYAIGVKTGYTKHSGRCLVSAAKKGKKRLICVVLNVPDTYGVTRSLFDKCFARESEGAENACEKGENTVS